MTSSEVLEKLKEWVKANKHGYNSPFVHTVLNSLEAKIKELEKEVQNEN